MKGGKYAHVCFDKGGKSHMGTVKKKKENIRFSTPIILVEEIQEKEHGNKMAKIKGTAINASVSRNGVLYEFEELDKAKETLLGKSIAMGHSEDPADIVGIIDEVMMTDKGMDYIGRAYSTSRYPDTVEMIRNGLIKHVSIEAIAPDIEPNKEGVRVAKNLEFLGLGFVRHPGIADASASIAEQLQKIEEDLITEEELNELIKRGENMAEEKPQEPQTSSELKEALDTTKESLKALQESMKASEVLKSEIEALKEKFKTLEEKPESKGVITETGPQEQPYIFEKAVMSENLQFMKKTHLGKEDKVILYNKGAGKDSQFFPLNPETWY